MFGFSLLAPGGRAHKNSRLTRAFAGCLRRAGEGAAGSLRRSCMALQAGCVAQEQPAVENGLIFWMRPRAPTSAVRLARLRRRRWAVPRARRHERHRGNQAGLRPRGQSPVGAAPLQSPPRQPAAIPARELLSPHGHPCAAAPPGQGRRHHCCSRPMTPPPAALSAQAAVTDPYVVAGVLKLYLASLPGDPAPPRTQTHRAPLPPQPGPTDPQRG